MRDHVQFVSDLFSPRRGEDEQVNPERYGEELATWLVEQLSRAGGSASGPYCGNVDGFRTDWLIWIQPHRSLFGRLLGRDCAAAIAELVGTLHSILRGEPRIGQLEWFWIDSRLQDYDRAEEPG